MNILPPRPHTRLDPGILARILLRKRTRQLLAVHPRLGRLALRALLLLRQSTPYHAAPHTTNGNTTAAASGIVPPPLPRAPQVVGFKP